jgi:hypothetical protein
VNGRLLKEAHALEGAGFAICDLHEEVGNIRAGLREKHLAESHIALDASLATMGPWQ